MIAESVEAGVSPGTAIMSRPTEQTLVMASRMAVTMAIGVTDILLFTIGIP